VGNLSALPRPGPAQGGKAGDSKLPERNLSNIKTVNKVDFVFNETFDVYDTPPHCWRRICSLSD
jgi:hypothetical protein